MPQFRWIRNLLIADIVWWTQVFILRAYNCNLMTHKPCDQRTRVKQKSVLGVLRLALVQELTQAIVMHSFYSREQRLEAQKTLHRLLDIVQIVHGAYVPDVCTMLMLEATWNSIWKGLQLFYHACSIVQDSWCRRHTSVRCNGDVVMPMIPWANYGTYFWSQCRLTEYLC